MPVTKDIISSLKRTNISADEEKTKLRVKDDFIGLRNKQKAAIVELTGLKRTSIYRVFREGNVSAKIVLALAQSLNVSPYYYTGEIEEKGEFNDMLLQEFLANKGYTRLAERVAATMQASGDQTVSASGKVGMRGFSFPAEFSSSPVLNAAAAAMSEDEAVQLLKALLIRAKAGGNAVQVADFVKHCLLM